MHLLKNRVTERFFQYLDSKFRFKFLYNLKFKHYERVEFRKDGKVTGGGFIDEACAVIGFSGTGLAVRAAIGMAINPVAGTIIGLAGVACFAYSIGN